MTHLSRIYSYVCIIVISLLLPANTFAQKKLPMIEEPDTLPLLRGIAVSYDLAGTIMRMVSDYGQYEAAVRANLKDKFFPTVEIGLGSAKHETDAVTGLACKTNAPYGRIGCDMNIAKNKHDDYRVLIGARYAFTSFKQEMTGTVTDPYWGGTSDFNATMDRCAYHWAELLFAVDAKLFGPVRMGWSVRYRCPLYKGDSGNNNIWYIPGYGKKGNVLGGTFNIALQLGK